MEKEKLQEHLDLSFDYRIKGLKAILGDDDIEGLKKLIAEVKEAHRIITTLLWNCPQLAIITPIHLIITAHMHYLFRLIV